MSNLFEDVHFLSSTLGELSLTDFCVKNDISDSLYMFNSDEYIYNNNGQTIPKGRLILGLNSDGRIWSVVHDYSNVIVTNNTISGGYLSIKLVNGLETQKINITNDGTTMTTGSDQADIPNGQLATAGWWECTVDCYDYLSDACADDPDCDLMCTLINLYNGYCDLSMAAACGIYCIDNSNFNPPVNISQLSTTNPYGFY